MRSTPAARISFVEPATSSMNPYSLIEALVRQSINRTFHTWGLTPTPKLLMAIKTTEIRKKRTAPSIAFGTFQKATSPAMAVIMAANVIEYVNLKDVSHQTHE